jgi:hypothetical protein
MSNTIHITMKTKIQSYKPKFKLKLPYGGGDLTNLEMVLRRHMLREFKDRNNLSYMKPLTRMDVRDAVKAIRYIKQAKLEVANVD